MWNIEIIASGRGVQIRQYIERTYGQGRWRKMKGIATVELEDDTICEAGIHGSKPTALAGGIIRLIEYFNERIRHLHRK